jgi:hypothetical protein
LGRTLQARVIFRSVRGTLASVGVVAALAFAGGASATESTIYPGVGIGKVKLGMTLAQVKHVLGPGAIVNDRETVNGSPFVELGWNFNAWTVGILGSRAVSVATALRGQRTATRIGPGTFWLKLVKAYPGGVCTFPEERGSGLEYLVPHKGGTQTIFQMHIWPARAGYYGITAKTWFVVSVSVREPYQPRPEFAKDYPYRCAPGWRTTPLPRRR